MFNHKRGRGGCAEGEAFECSEFGGMRGRRGHRGARVRGGFGGGCGGFDEEFATGRGMGPGRAMGRGGGRGPGMRGGRRKRLFDQAELQALLLALIVEAPRHGYDLIREIETLSGGDYAPSPGVVYPALTYMEESGLIAVMADESSRKSYEATEEGRQQADVDAEKAALLKARLAALAEQRDRVDPAPVRRAMQALKTAVFDRLNQGGADRELTLQIADAIDEATRKIERIES
ncbi:hypothetical protein GCM10011349_17670 [Novosphingobium indicum]|uniref:Transcription regulator PadR N-terminal domain-containing protein n=2 Tax=Novosphingobium indicum TaxID=462949 RepID=A0ABQ2JNJ4_9SPHN|nr:hypothetical protein GCM10011349_17670 [Novosphingobium indicum]